ncbi:hypothetical protein SEA_AXYM_61 [Gordonia phage Axym]|uniref:Uncharacterized protein n=2 Tax=Emalynvirus cozz TaxID=2560490 RepID=A0A5Q2WEY1_9CAUD|nr:hypothetical protein PBI_NINA_62 [Gordonia phage Nina]QGH75928.1 hypothetical protein SEA_AXYM_61 [Gordonia phage Axym]
MMAQRVYKFKKKDFTLRDLAEIQNREALGPGNPTDSDWDPLDQPVAILTTFTTVEVKVGK